jgi:hypothetical protein
MLYNKKYKILLNIKKWTLVDSLTLYSRRFLFDLGLTVKRRTMEKHVIFKEKSDVT